ncbi:MAG TPA: GyrI-like domain-containing protein [Puia sp.]|nr:GyrI-like domain-containing protein [Puia sp.]
MKIFSIVLALLLFCLLAYLIPVSLTSRLTIDASFNNTLAQVVHPGNWKNWYPAGIDYHAEQRTPLSWQVETTTGSRPATFSFALLPTRFPDQVEIVVGSKTRLLYRLLPFDHHPSPGITAITALKSYLEDPNAFYGFPIAIQQVTDTVYLTIRSVLKKKDLFEKLPGLFSQLGQFIRDKDLRIVNDRSVSFEPARQDSLSVMAGIPVNRTVTGEGRIVCMQMPKGRMLVGRYRGSFAGRQALYKSMQRYRADHHLSLVADPYEQYTDNRLPVNDSSIISIELYFPIR